MSGRAKITGLDGLRFLAITHLVIFHLLAHHRAVSDGGQLFNSLPESLLNIVLGGPTATGMFFILSGFILTYVYVNPSLNGLKCDSMTFFLNRLFRIWPLHMVLMLALTAPALRMDGFAWPDFLINFFLLQTWFTGSMGAWNVPAWAASCILTLCLLFPLLVTYLGRFRFKGLVGVGVFFAATNIILCFLFRSLHEVLPAHQQEVLIRQFYYSPLIWVGYFMSGMAAALFFLRFKSLYPERSLIPFPNLWVGLILAVVVFNRMIPHVYMRHSVLLVFQVLMILSFAEGKGFLPKLCQRKGMQLMGACSFTIYLLHGPLMVFFAPLFKAYETIPFYASFLYLLTLFASAPLIERYFVEPTRRWLLQGVRLSRHKLPVLAPPQDSKLPS